MTGPRIELIPGKAAVCSDASIALDVLVRIASPPPDVHFPRPPLNLALVLDRSGSMAGAKKMPYAVEAASFAVRQLLPTDRVSVTSFDDRVETIAPSTLAVDKPAIVRRIEAIEPRGSTDLHGGWAEGVRQAESRLVPGGLNRVLLLSDGLANVGVTDPNAIAAHVREAGARGVGTTTLGVGDDYNEDLMEAMARAGDGNYYYIESPVQLVDLFQTELEGLMATLGQKASLALEPAAGAIVSDVLNDFTKAPAGRWLLPNLIVGMPIQVVVRLVVPPRQDRPDAADVPLLAVHLAWDDPREPGPRALGARLGPLPALPLADWSARPIAPEVAEHVALLMVARSQKEASRAHERGDYAGTMSALGAARAATFAAPMSATISDELAAIDKIEAAVRDGNDSHARKFAKFRSYLRHAGRTKPPPPPTDAEPGEGKSG